MTKTSIADAAVLAAEQALDKLRNCLDSERSFLLEAGAGSGKTHSLGIALEHLIEKRGAALLRRHQRVACITYTKVARDEIERRIDHHPAVHCATIHSLCWSLISGMQSALRQELFAIGKWAERIAEHGEIGGRTIRYEFGIPAIREDEILLHHDDVIELSVALLRHEKFRARLRDSYPVLFVDEYQDTEAELAHSLFSAYLDHDGSALLGLFGDSWQQIYRKSCGHFEHPALEVIPLKSNFRSDQAIVEVLNRVRPKLSQAARDATIRGSVGVYYTNSWIGERRSGQHWKGDLPAEVARTKLADLRGRLASAGWDVSPEQTKILMLTHGVLASQLGYPNLVAAFRYNDSFAKKEDPHIAFFADVLEPTLRAFESKKFGEMFHALNLQGPKIRSRADKREWTDLFETLLQLRVEGTVGEMMSHLESSRFIAIPHRLQRRRERLVNATSEEVAESRTLREVSNLYAVAYREVVALVDFLNEQSLFSTKHGVKGAQFENVLVVFGRGWNHYNFNQMLEWGAKGTPAAREQSFVRNRNLFYVVCSRAKMRLALLFTQELSSTALCQLAEWFGEEAIEAI